MRTEKYRQLTDVHLLNRIWRSDLEIALHEVNFWEDLLNALDADLDPVPATHDDTWKTELGQLHHFRRLIKRLLEEIQDLDKQITAWCTCRSLTGYRYPVEPSISARRNGQFSCQFSSV